MPSSLDANAQSHQWLRDAIQLRQNGDDTGAITLYHRVIELNANDYAVSRAYLMGALARRATGDYAGALADCVSALRDPVYLMPGGVAAAQIFGGASGARMGRWPQAGTRFKAVFDACIKASDNDLEIPFAVPLDIELAAADLGSYLEVYPTSTSALFCRGLVWRAGGHASQAVADFMAASALEPGNRRLLVWARTQDQLGYGNGQPYQRPYLRPGIDYVWLEYAMDPPASASVSRYDVERRATETVSIGQADQLRRQLERDGWLLLYRTNHKEGYSYLYWRAKAG